MVEYARQHWREFSESRPGKRFQERYRRRQESGHGPFSIRRIINLTLGILIVAVSAVGGLLPGPGWGTAIIGFALIAGEVLLAARFLDRAEVQLRNFIQFCKDVWTIANPVGKALIVVFLAACASGLIYVLYALVFRGLIS